MQIRQLAFGRRSAAIMIAAAGLSLVSGASLAQTYPERTVTIVVPFDAGGTPDLIARQITTRLSESMGQQFIVDNKPGAGGSIGSRFVAQAKPDGYTLVMGTISTHAVNNAVLPNPTYDPVKDFEAVAQVGGSASALVVPADLPVNSVKELVEYGKKNKLRYGSSGVGSSNHLSGALFSKMYNLDAVHVPYKGGPPAVLDLLSGQIQYLLYAPIALIPHIKSGKLKALVLAGSARSPSLPDVPTAAELGIADFDVSGFAGMFAPAKTPKPVVDKLHAEIGKVLANADFQGWMTTNGLDVAKNVSQADFAQLVKTEVVRWANIAEVAGVRAK